MNPNHRPSPTHKLAALVAVALFLSLAGASVVLFLRHRREVAAESHNVGRHTSREPDANRPFFGPEIQMFELFEEIDGPEQPAITQNVDGPSLNGNGNGLSSNFSSFTLPTASSSAGFVRSNRPESAPEALITPKSALQLPASSAAAPSAETTVAETPIAEVPTAAAPVLEAPIAVPIAAAPATSAAVAPDTLSGAPQASTQPSTVPHEQPPPAALVVCGSAQCSNGEVCCNASCGTCARPGEVCSQQVCGMSTLPVSLPCGLNTCNVGEVCCNANCGTCARSQADCDSAQECDNPIEYPTSESCGMVTCNTGLVCCNPSCGICAPYGVPCSQHACD